MRRRSRHIVAVAGTAALAAGLAGAGPAGAVPSITGTDADVWNAASPATTYVLTAQAPGARITWELEGPGGGGGSGPGGPGRSGDGRSPITVSLPGLGDGTFRLAARERGLFGGRAARAFLVDRTAPTIAISRPLDGSSVAQGGSLLAAYACDGATSCAGTVPSGAGLDTTSPGAGRLRVSAADAAGNTATSQVDYLVLAAGESAPPPRTAREPAPPPRTAPEPAVVVPRSINAGRLLPHLNGVVATPRPVLRWPARTGARLYNVQVFRLRVGAPPAKIASVFPRTNSVRLPPDRLRAGVLYAWRVWPFMRGGFTPKPLGLSVFSVGPIRP